MDEKLRVSFNSPQCGWMSFELKAGEQTLADTLSYTPYDSLFDLINALRAILAEDTTLRVKWALEPDELDLTFSARGDEAALEVDWYQNQQRAVGTGERVFSFRGSRLDLCHPFWKALRDLQGDIEVDEFARNWRREFPERELLRLTEEIRAYKQRQALGA